MTGITYAALWALGLLLGAVLGHFRGSVRAGLLCTLLLGPAFGLMALYALTRPVGEEIPERPWSTR